MRPRLLDSRSRLFHTPLELLMLRECEAAPHLFCWRHGAAAGGHRRGRRQHWSASLASLLLELFFERAQTQSTTLAPRAFRRGARRGTAAATATGRLLPRRSGPLFGSQQLVPSRWEQRACQGTIGCPLAPRGSRGLVNSGLLLLTSLVLRFELLATILAMHNRSHSQPRQVLVSLLCRWTHEPLDRKLFGGRS